MRLVVFIFASLQFYAHSNFLVCQSPALSLSSVSVQSTKQLLSQTPPWSMKLKNMCIRYAQKGGVGFGIELLIQFSPHLNLSAIKKMMPPPLIASFASSICWLKREKAGSCTRQDALRPIFLLVSALSRWLRCQGSLFDTTRGTMSGIVQNDLYVSILFATSCDICSTCFPEGLPGQAFDGTLWSVVECQSLESASTTLFDFPAYHWL